MIALSFNKTKKVLFYTSIDKLEADRKKIDKLLEKNAIKVLDETGKVITTYDVGLMYDTEEEKSMCKAMGLIR